MKKRILIAVGVRWWNASAHYAVDLARSLADRGHEVLVATRAGTPAARKAEAGGIEVDSGFDFRPRCLLRDVYRMARLLRRRPFDILNPHRAGEQNVMVLALHLARRQTPILRTRVDVKEEAVRPNPANLLVYQRLIQGVVAPGEASRQLIMRHYRVPSAQIATVHGGVDTELFTPKRRNLELRRKLGVKDDKLAVGIVARLGKIKGHVHLFDAIGKLRARHGWNGDGPAFLVIGPETDYSIDRLREEAKKRGAPEVIFTGYREDIADVTACLDVGVVTSVGSEAHCRVGLEMLASAVPVVGTRVGVIPEIVKEGTNGFLVPVRDGNQLADRLEELLTNSELRRRLSDSARREALARYTFKAWAERTESAFERLATTG